MGYYSDVAITLNGNKQEVKDLLNAYRLTETADNLQEAWHLLANPNPDDNGSVRFFYEVIGTPEDIVQLTWLFSGVKWYDASEGALNRLGDLLDDMQTEGDKYQSLAITLQRLGENPDDFDEKVWGENPYDYENPVDVVRHFDIQAPVVDVNPTKYLFENEGN